MEPGKYDDVCDVAREAVGITNESGGGILLIVIGGNKGNGFSVQCDLRTALTIPGLLRNVADDLEEQLLKPEKH